MKEMFNTIKANYLELTSKLKELTDKENELNIVGIDIYNRFEEADNEVIDLRNKYLRMEAEILNKGDKYVLKKHRNHLYLIMGIACAIFAFITGINYSIITHKVLAAFGCLVASCFTGILDMLLFWDKLTPVYNKKFDELESTKKLKEELKKLYDLKHEKEKILANAQERLNEHSILLNSILSEKKRIQEQINELKEKSFEQILIDTDVQDYEKPMELKRK